MLLHLLSLQLPGDHKPRFAAPPADPLQAAKARVKTASDALAKEQVPMATEPAFQFKA